VDQLKRLEPLLPSSAVSESEVVSARLRVNREESQLRVANYSAEEMKAEVDRLQAEDQMRQDEIRGAAIEVEKAELAMKRTRITSPIDGRVLRLHAAPGQKKMLQDQDPESSTVAILYRPDQLQIRVDVPLADAGRLQPGQRVRSRCSLFPDRILNGKVLLISGEADLQRNTLQAKVSIEDPASELRPEMLCRVEFLISEDPRQIKASSADTLACWVPTAAVTSEHEVWVCDPESRRIHKRSVKPTNEQREGYLCISEGLMPGEWVVLSPQGLRDGQRVHPNLVEK
jgi:HlyD family secretion protein